MNQLAQTAIDLELAYRRALLRKGAKLPKTGRKQPFAKPSTKKRK